MPVYHSKHNEASNDMQQICKAAVLPLNEGCVKGPAAVFRPGNDKDMDIVDEALTYFRANILFQKFEVEGPADRVLVYLTAWIADCLRLLEKSKTKGEAQKQAHTIGINKKFKVPGENGFPFGPFFDKPKNNTEKQTFVDYFQQIRHETVNRLIERAYKDDKQDKFWFQFGKKRFMNAWNM